MTSFSPVAWTPEKAPALEGEYEANSKLAAADRWEVHGIGPEDVVIDFFAHSGATLIAAEKLGRRCITTDIDPICAEICIRRLERYRQTGKTGWQMESMFEKELLHPSNRLSAVNAR